MFITIQTPMAENAEDSTESTTETNVNIEMLPRGNTEVPVVEAIRNTEHVRAPDRTMRLADHISSAIEEITPLLEQARPVRFIILYPNYAKYYNTFVSGAKVFHKIVVE